MISPIRIPKLKMGVDHTTHLTTYTSDRMSWFAGKNVQEQHSTPVVLESHPLLFAARAKHIESPKVRKQLLAWANM